MRRDEHGRSRSHRGQPLGWYFDRAGGPGRLGAWRGVESVTLTPLGEAVAAALDLDTAAA